MYFQVVCKKFQISCPAEVAFLINETVNSTLAQPTAFVPDVAFNMTEGDSCQPHYFIFNSQVTIIFVSSEEDFREENRENTH